MNPPSEQPLSQPDPEHIVDQPRRSADPTGWHSLPDTTATYPAQNGYVQMAGADQVEAPVDSTDDDLLLAEVDHRPSRTTVLLVAGILAAVAFVGGAVVQKHYGNASSSALPGAAAGFGARPGNAGGYGNFGGGAGFPGAGQAGAGTQGGTGGAAAGGAAGGTGAAGGAATGGGTATAASPVVVGTVTKLSASALTVKNLGGKSVKVKVPEGATITLVAGKTLTTLKTGATVSVAGTTAADGTVTATLITVRQ